MLGGQNKMPKCSFCRRIYEFPRGLTLALNDGAILHFCSSKCRKNSELGRKSQKVNWVRKMKHAETETIEEIKKAAEEKTEKVVKKEEKETKIEEKK